MESPREECHSKVLSNLRRQFWLGKQKYLTLHSNSAKQYAILYVTDGGEGQPEFIAKSGQLVKPDTILQVHQLLGMKTSGLFHYPPNPDFNYCIAKPRQELGTFVHTEEVLLVEVFPEIERQVFHYGTTDEKEVRFVYLYTYFLPCERCLADVIQPFRSRLQDSYSDPVPKLIIGYSEFQPGRNNPRLLSEMRLKNIRKYLEEKEAGEIHRI